MKIGRLSISFAWYDMWIGLFVTSHAFYVCPLPCVLFKWVRKGDSGIFFISTPSGKSGPFENMLRFREYEFENAW